MQNTLKYYFFKNHRFKKQLFAFAVDYQLNNGLIWQYGDAPRL